MEYKHNFGIMIPDQEPHPCFTDVEERVPLHRSRGQIPAWAPVNH